MIASLAAGLGLVFAVGLSAAMAMASADRAKPRPTNCLARQNAYAADMNLAQRALQEHDLGRALELLNNYRPNSAEQKSEIRTVSEIDRPVSYPNPNPKSKIRNRSARLGMALSMETMPERRTVSPLPTTPT